MMNQLANQRWWEGNHAGWTDFQDPEFMNAMLNAFLNSMVDCLPSVPWPGFLDVDIIAGTEIPVWCKC